MNKIQLLLDNPNSWMVPYAREFQKKLLENGHDTSILHTHDVEEGDVLILLSCEKKFLQLNKNKYNLIVHESDLPKGKGWSPLTHQILSGKNKIPITLFEADHTFDGGNIYYKDIIELNGTELIDEIRKKQAEMTFNLINRFLEENNIVGKKQTGYETYYKKRTPKDSKLDINDSIINQFNLLRVVDNDRYPAYFEHQGYKYIIKVYRDE